MFKNFELNEDCNFVFLLKSYIVDSSDAYVEPSDEDFSDLFEEIQIALERNHHGKHYRKLFGKIGEFSVYRGIDEIPDHVKVRLYSSGWKMSNELSDTAANVWRDFPWAEGTEYRLYN